ncbi:MAG TPA: dephospho-CoA kinase [Mycobacteriales bacterium]|nr:dephospho-CoA kinase [Mycobacteriales bacterium]
MDSVFRVGLTGGIGSGKSAVATQLAAHGAVLIDADALAREVVEPHTPGLRRIVAEFGPEVLTADGRLDRGRLAGLVFADSDALARLNAIVHPLVGERAAGILSGLPADAVVVHDVPLLVENGLWAGYDLVLVVEAPEPVRIARLSADRGMTEPEARARMAAQATDAQRRAVADAVIVNDGSRQDLAAAVDEIWDTRVAPRVSGY